MSSIFESISGKLSISDMSLTFITIACIFAPSMAAMFILQPQLLNENIAIVFLLLFSGGSFIFVSTYVLGIFGYMSYFKNKKFSISTSKTLVPFSFFYQCLLLIPALFGFSVALEKYPPISVLGDIIGGYYLFIFLFCGFVTAVMIPLIIIFSALLANPISRLMRRIENKTKQ